MAGWTHEQVLDEVVGYLMGELAPSDQTAVETHLAVCPACQAETERMREALDALSHDVPQVEPPARLRAAVLTAIERETRQPEPPRRATRSSWQRWLPSAAALLLALTTAASGLGLLRAERTADRLRAENRRLTGTLAQARSQLSVTVLQLAAVGGGDAVASLAVARGPARAEAVLSARGLAPLHGQQVYQLWYLNGGAPLSAGVLVVHGGTGVLRVQLPPRLTTVRAAAISREPHAGDVRPLGPIVLRSVADV